MANKAGKLYIRNKVGYRKPPKKLADLPEGESFVLFWYEGKAKKAKAVGRFADRAQTALINKEAALRRASRGEWLLHRMHGTKGRDRPATRVVRQWALPPGHVCLRAGSRRDRRERRRKIPLHGYLGVH